MWSNGTLTNFTCDPSVVHYRYFGALLGSAVTAVGGVGNIMTLLAFAVDARIRTRFNLLIFNLTLADLFYCVILQPVTVDTYLHMRWGQGDTLCRLFGLLLFGANLVSILNLALIALSRYVLVSDPRRFDRVFSARAMPFFLAGPWLLTVGLMVPFWGVFQFLPAVCTCSFHRSKGRPYTTIFHVASFSLGLGCISLFYLLIYRKLRAAGRAVRSYGIASAGASSAAREGGSQSEGGLESSADPEERESNTASEGSEGGRLRRATRRWRERRTKRKRDVEFRRVTAMCFAMFLVYVCCYLPFCLVHMVGRMVPSVVQMFAGNLTWLNSCANPILYAAMNRQFKEAYRAVLRLFCAPFGCRG